MRRGARALAALLCLVALVSCGYAGGDMDTPPETDVVPEIDAEEKDVDPDTGLEILGRMELQYATQFSAAYLEGGGAMITVAGREKFLLMPEGAAEPERVAEDVTVLRGPFENVYLAASSAMDFFRVLGKLDAVRFTSTEEESWSGFPEVSEALESESMYYIGKYSAPDYEALLEADADLAIESTMIWHSPKVSEYIEDLGIPVLVERSSYEPHPLGRVEWIKLYGLLMGRSAEAEEFFEGELERLAPILDAERTGEGPKIAYFALNANGTATVRKPGDYISRLIEMAGGEYAFSGLPGQDENDLSTINIQMETFYEGARDADILIYNSTIDGELFTMEELLDKSGVLADFEAVREGRVWCTGRDMFREVTALGDILRDMSLVIEDPEVEDGELTYLHRLR